MSEQFIPVVKSAGDTPAAAPVPLDVLANQELAKVMQDGRVTQLMTFTATLHQLLPVTVIENQSQYDQVIDAFDSAKKLLKLIEERRVEIVGFPTKVVSLINDLFRQLRIGVEIAKTHFGALIEAKKQFDAQNYAMSQQAAVEQGPQSVQIDDGIEKVQFESTQEAPMNVVKSAKGAKVHSRTDIEVTIVDLVAFLKVLTSTNKRYADISALAGEIVEIKIGPLKKLIKEGNRKKIPGLKIEQTSRTV